MKPVLLLAFISVVALTACGQGDKSKRPSPPAKAGGTTAKGDSILIDYSQPSVKGRTIGKDLDPLPGKVWRTGANEATVFEIKKDAKIQGSSLPAGKYSLYTLADGDNWTIIFNKTWNQWGTIYKQSEDALRVQTKSKKTKTFVEKFSITISKDGKIDLLWGDYDVPFTVE